MEALNHLLEQQGNDQSIALENWTYIHKVFMTGNYFVTKLLKFRHQVMDQ